MKCITQIEHYGDNLKICASEWYLTSKYMKPSIWYCSTNANHTKECTHFNDTIRKVIKIAHVSKATCSRLFIIRAHNNSFEILRINGRELDSPWLKSSAVANAWSRKSDSKLDKHSLRPHLIVLLCIVNIWFYSRFDQEFGEL